MAQIKYLLLSFSHFMEVHPKSTFSHLPQVTIKIKFRLPGLAKVRVSYQPSCPRHAELLKESASPNRTKLYAVAFAITDLQ